MQPSKWDLILERKPQPLAEHLVSELATLFADELGRWPPAVDELDASTARALEELLTRHPEAPPWPAYDESFTIAQWDLSHDAAAVDDYFRNHRYLDAGLAASDRGLVLFLSRLIVEQLLALSEATEGRLNRGRLLELLERTRAALLARSPSPAV
jgi:hypothetical protein